VRNKTYNGRKSIPKVADITFKICVPAALGAASTNEKPSGSASASSA
jgi:hypothetical protein